MPKAFGTPYDDLPSPRDWNVGDTVVRRATFHRQTPGRISDECNTTDLTTHRWIFRVENIITRYQNDNDISYQTEGSKNKLGVVGLRRRVGSLVRRMCCGGGSVVILHHLLLQVWRYIIVCLEWVIVTNPRTDFRRIQHYDSATLLRRISRLKHHHPISRR